MVEQEAEARAPFSRPKQLLAGDKTGLDEAPRVRSCPSCT